MEKPLPPHDELASLCLLLSYDQIVPLLNDRLLGSRMQNQMLWRALVGGDFPDALEGLPKQYMSPSMWCFIYETMARETFFKSFPLVAYLKNRKGVILGSCEIKMAQGTEHSVPTVFYPTESLGGELPLNEVISVSIVCGNYTPFKAEFDLSAASWTISRLGPFDDTSEHTQVQQGVQFTFTRGEDGRTILLRSISTPFPNAFIAYGLLRSISDRKAHFADQFAPMSAIRGLANSIYKKDTMPVDLPFSSESPLAKSQRTLTAHLEGHTHFGVFAHDPNHYYVGKKINGRPCCKKGHTFTRAFLENWLTVNLGTKSWRCPLCRGGD